MTEIKNSNPSERLTSGSLLARNTVFNFIGQGAPLGVAVLAIPILIKGLGMNRFGVLALAWALIGYCSLFDLGLGRALTKLLADKLGSGQEKVIPALVWTALFLLLILGLVGALVVGLLSPWLCHHLLKVPAALQTETLHAFYLLAVSIPVVISTAGLRGILEAQQRFGLINTVRIGMGVFTFLGPLMVLPFSQSLFPVVAVLAAGRLVACLIYLLICFYVMPELVQGIVIKRAEVAPLLHFGSWITVSNIVGPIMVYLDRFFIGALVSIVAVTYYVTPYEVVTKLWLIPSSMVAVLFPAFAISFEQDPSRTALLFGRGIKYVFLVLFPITLVIVTLAEGGLDLWLGKEFAQHSTRILQWLTIGVFINSLAHTPFALVQGLGRPDLTAKLHLIELPFYVFAVWWMIGAYGIKGAAIAWLARVSVDAVILFGIAGWLLPKTAPAIQGMSLMLGPALLVLAFSMLPMGITMNGVFLLLVLSTFVLAAWFLILTPEERKVVENCLKMGRVIKQRINFRRISHDSSIQRKRDRNPPLS